MGTILRVVPAKSDPLVVKELGRLLQEAVAGRIIGFAYVALRPHHEYSADLVGTVLDSPLLSRGICRALEDAVAESSKKA